MDKTEFKVYDNGWNEGETSIEVSNDKIERGDFYLTIGKPFNPYKNFCKGKLCHIKNVLPPTSKAKTYHIKCRLLFIKK